LVGNGVVKPEVGKLEAIQEFPRPTSKNRFVGNRKFIPNNAFLAFPFTELNAPNQLETKSCERAFQHLKGLPCQTYGQLTL